MPVASDIDDVIAFASTDVAEVSYGGVDSLYTQMQEWTAGMFSEATGIFPPNANATSGQRAVTNWYTMHLKAIETIEGSGVGASGVLGTSSCIDVIVRAAYAVKYAAINGDITGAQQTAVVTLYNNVWA